MKPGNLSTFLRTGAIWAFVLLELAFFGIVGDMVVVVEHGLSGARTTSC